MMSRRHVYKLPRPPVSLTLDHPTIMNFKTFSFLLPAFALLCGAATPPPIPPLQGLPQEDAKLWLSDLHGWCQEHNVAETKCVAVGLESLGILPRVILRSTGPSITPALLGNETYWEEKNTTPWKEFEERVGSVHDDIKSLRAWSEVRVDHAVESLKQIKDAHPDKFEAFLEDTLTPDDLEFRTTMAKTVIPIAMDVPLHGLYTILGTPTTVSDRPEVQNIYQVFELARENLADLKNRKSQELEETVQAVDDDVEKLSDFEIDQKAIREALKRTVTSIRAYRESLRNFIDDSKRSDEHGDEYEDKAVLLKKLQESLKDEL